MGFCILLTGVFFVALSGMSLIGFVSSSEPIVVYGCLTFGIFLAIMGILIIKGEE